MSKLWWLSLIRGGAALLLGGALLATPVKGRALLAQYMAMYWLASGLLTIVWGLRGARFTRLWLAAGIVGVLGGLFIVLRSLYDHLLAPGMMINLFAVVAILTGVLHMLGGYRIRQEHGRRWARGSFFLGLFQILMGVLIFSSPEEVPRGVVAAAMIWALIGGIGLILDALRLRRLHRGVVRTGQV